MAYQLQLKDLLLPERWMNGGCTEATRLFHRGLVGDECDCPSPDQCDSGRHIMMLLIEMRALSHTLGFVEGQKFAAAMRGD